MKACKSCKLIVPEHVQKCPNCGEEDFTRKFRGVFVLIDESSALSERLGFKKKGTYALEV